MQISINPFKYYHHTKMNRLWWWIKDLRFAPEGQLITVPVYVVLPKSVVFYQEYPFGMLLGQDIKWYIAGDTLYVPANTDGVMGKLLLYFGHWSFHPSLTVAGNQHHLAPGVQVQHLLCSEVVGNTAAESTAAASRKRTPGVNFPKDLGW